MIIKTIKLNKIILTSTILLLIIAICSISIYAFSNGEFPLIWNSNKSDENNYIKWVDFTPTNAVLTDTSKLDIDSHNDINSTIKYNWIELLSYLACKYGGNFKKYNKNDLINLTEKLQNGATMEELTKDMKYYSYYFEAYDAVLHEFIGEYQIESTVDSAPEYETKYGIKVFLPIAKNYGFSHYDDFGNSRSYGYKRTHLGNDLMGSIRNSHYCC